MIRSLRQMLQPRPPRAVRGWRRAQALTEFAITVPVMVTLLLFAIYFYEIIQIKLKAQEVARYAAWEFTGFPLHDYDTGHADGFDSAKEAIQDDIGRRYANLRSIDNQHGDAWLMVGWDAPKVRLRNTPEPRIPGGSLVNTIFTIATYVIDIYSMLAYTHGNPVLAAMMGYTRIENRSIFGGRANRFNPPRRWGFNTNGYIKAKVTVRFHNLLIPEHFMEGATGWFKEDGQNVKHFQGTRMRFREDAALVADSWRMNYGEDVEGPKDKKSPTDKPYFKQVGRMAFISRGVKQAINIYWSLVRAFSAIITSLALQPPLMVDPLETTLVSKAYKDGDPNSGTITIQEDHGSVRYDTSPFGRDGKGDDEYKKTFDKRGKHFMGCKEPEKLGCFDSLSSNNPFGEFVDPPEE